ncbi:MAG: ATP-binding protein [Pseudomonadota bacterium]
MRSWIFAVALLAFALLPFEASAQRYAVRTYDEATGLRSSEVSAITQDPQGRMLLATRRGIVRYDSARWEVLDDSIPTAGSPRVHRWDDAFNLWSISIQDPNQISRYDGNRWSQVGIPLEASSARLAAFDARAETPHDLAVLLANGELLLRQGSPWLRVALPGVGYAVHLGDDGAWVGTSEGLWHVPPGDGEPVQHLSEPVHAVSRGPRGRQWFLSESGIGILAPEGPVMLSAAPPVDAERLRLHIGSNGDVLLYSPFAVLRLLPSGSFEPLSQRSGLIGSGADDVLEDRQGNIWIASARGLSRIPGFRFASYGAEHGLYENEVTAVLETAPGVLLLGHPTGLTRLADRPTSTDFDQPGWSRVLEFARGPSGSVWAAAQRIGLLRIDPDLGYTVHPDVPPSVVSVTTAANGTIWSTTPSALYRSPGGDRFTEVALPLPAPIGDIRRVTALADGRIAVATASAGVLILEDGTWTRFEDPDFRGNDINRSTNNVLAVQIDNASGRTLVGTAAGLFEISGDRLVRAQPEIHCPVFFILEHPEAGLWIGTDNGVIQHQNGVATRFSVETGLAGRETNRGAGLIDSSGRVWVGTDRGLTALDANAARPFEVPPVVTLLEIDIDGRAVVPDAPLATAYEENDIYFRFAAASFVDERLIEVEARLDGYDDDWIRLPSGAGRELRYTNLPPGEYTLELRAGSAVGAWSEPIGSPAITVKRPIWSSTGFSIGMVVALMAALAFIQILISRWRYAGRLEREVERRVAEEQQVEAKIHRAQRLEALGKLAGGIAHDFNNLMAVILGNLSLVRMDVTPGSDADEQLDETEAALLRARELTGQLLTFARGGEPVRAAVPVRQLIDEAASLALSGTPVRWEVDIATDTPDVLADHGQMLQALGNIILNAREAMPDGGTVTITACRLPAGRQGDPSVEIAVADRGCGIEEEMLGTVFDPYVSTKEPGRGLGLSTAYSIVYRHDGSVDVYSEPGIGTTMTVVLPAAPLETAPAEQPRELPAVAVDDARILVMDDEPAVLRVISATLERAGFTVVTATHGDEALSAYEEARGSPETCFDAVILDLTVRGGAGGRETMAAMLASDPDVRGIVLSGYADDPVMADCTAHGFRAAVGKPFEPEVLVGVLRDVVASGRGARSARADDETELQEDLQPSASRLDPS